MICKDCGGILFVIKIHEEKDIRKNRLCDVQCIDCEKIYFYQPYDFGNFMNSVDGTKKE